MKLQLETNAGGVFMAVVCPECDNPLDIDVDEVEEGEIIQCDECGTDLEIVSVDPLELAPVDEEGYDDEDDAAVVEDDDDE
jgi:alpha-aminoadipate/glutamate carrier protein LysW